MKLSDFETTALGISISSPGQKYHTGPTVSRGLAVDGVGNPVFLQSAKLIKPFSSFCIDSFIIGLCSCLI